MNEPQGAFAEGQRISGSHERKFCLIQLNVLLCPCVIVSLAFHINARSNTCDKSRWTELVDDERAAAAKSKQSARAERKRFIKQHIEYFHYRNPVEGLFKREASDSTRILHFIYLLVYAYVFLFRLFRNSSLCLHSNIFKTLPSEHPPNVPCQNRRRQESRYSFFKSPSRLITTECKTVFSVGD